jgi:hypothetical protein
MLCGLRREENSRFPPRRGARSLANSYSMRHSPKAFLYSLLTELRITDPYLPSHCITHSGGLGSAPVP